MAGSAATALAEEAAEADEPDPDRRRPPEPEESADAPALLLAEAEEAEEGMGMAQHVLSTWPLHTTTCGGGWAGRGRVGGAQGGRGWVGLRVGPCSQCRCGCAKHQQVASQAGCGAHAYSHASHPSAIKPCPEPKLTLGAFWSEALEEESDEAEALEAAPAMALRSGHSGGEGGEGAGALPPVEALASALACGGRGRGGDQTAMVSGAAEC